jgi:tetratricopeptide (TPR) repeat protein
MNMNRSLLSRVLVLSSLLMLHPCFSYADINDSLRVAIIHGDIESVKLFLRDGADVNKIFDDQSTPLLEAVNNAAGSGDIVRLLLQYGAKPSLKPAGTSSAVTAALKTNNEVVIRLLRPYAEDEGEFYGLALFFRNKKEENRALEYADQALNLNPFKAEAWALKASIFLSQKNSKDADMAYHKAFESSLVDLKTVNSEDHYNTAVWYALLSSLFNEAEILAREGLALFPDDGILGLNSGHALLFLGQKKEALASYKKGYADLQRSERYADRDLQVLNENFSNLTGRYPDRIAELKWAENRILEPFDFNYARITFGEERDAVLNLLKETDVRKELPPIIGILDPVFKKQLGKGLFALDLRSQLSATVVEKYSVANDKWDAVEHIDLFFKTISGQSEQRTLFLVSKFFKVQQGKLEAIFGTMQEDISKELDVQPAVHDTKILSRSGPLPAMIASWKVKDVTVILDAYSESSLTVRSRIFYVSNKGWGQYLSMLSNRQVSK